ncbi:hypothetical protein DPSP01_013131 [Paraphaeosphaeria sporulosa]
MLHAITEFQRHISSTVQGCVQVPVFDLHRVSWESRTYYLTNKTLEQYTAVVPRTGVIDRDEVAKELDQSLLYNIAMLNPAAAPAAAPAAVPATATMAIVKYGPWIWSPDHGKYYRVVTYNNGNTESKWQE